MTNFDYGLDDLDKFIYETRFDYRSGPMVFEAPIDIERAMVLLPPRSKSFVSWSDHRHW